MSLRVSDHALLRFLDRAGGLDVEELRLALEEALARAGAAAAQIGGGDYLIQHSGKTFVVRDGARGPVVTTMLERDPPNVRYRRLRRPPPAAPNGAAE